MHPRRFVRVKPSGLVSKRAKIITEPKLPAIDVTLIDYSAGGACLDFGGQVSVPTRFELLHSGSHKRCRVVWKRGTRIGVAF